MATRVEARRDVALREYTLRLANAHDELARESREHPGEYVARAFDGRPLAYAATEAELERRLRAMDLDPEAVVIDFVAPPHLSDAT